MQLSRAPVVHARLAALLAATITLRSSPLFCPLCSCVGHCTNCTLWHGTPIAGAILYQLTTTDPAQPFAPLHVTNQPSVRFFSKRGDVHRHFCTRCGTHVFLTNPQLKLVILQPGLWRDSGLRFEPSAHMNYERCQVRVPDGLTKFKDFPKEYGGSGEQCTE